MVTNLFQSSVSSFRKVGWLLSSPQFFSQSKAPLLPFSQPSSSAVKIQAKRMLQNFPAVRLEFDSDKVEWFTTEAHSKTKYYNMITFFCTMVYLNNPNESGLKGIKIIIMPRLQWLPHEPQQNRLRFCRKVAYTNVGNPASSLNIMAS